jgi:putative PIN family toxin of toxin-antitoxin system
MRVVLDTNVLVAGLLSAAGPPGWIVEAMLAGELEPVFDAAIRSEYEDVLRRPEFNFLPTQIDYLLAALDQFAFQVTAPAPWPVSLPDPDDEPFLATAAAARSILVTGNLRHFPPAKRRGVIVMTPREFVDARKDTDSHRP